MRYFLPDTAVFLSFVNIKTLQVRKALWLNFFKEACLFDYLYKVCFVNTTINYLLKGPLLFNFNFLNKLQLFSLYNLTYILYLGVDVRFDLTQFFKVLFKSSLWVMLILTTLIVL